MEARFHRRVQADLDEILTKYYEVSDELGNDFFAEFQLSLRNVCEAPKFYHFDASGLRRCNFDRFPYHFLYDVQSDRIRIWVVRHDHRDPKFGVRRFSK